MSFRTGLGHYIKQEIPGMKITKYQVLRSFVSINQDQIYQDFSFWEINVVHRDNLQ